MKQFTIAVLFLVSLVAQNRAQLVVCDIGGESPWYLARTGECDEIIKDNRDSPEPITMKDGRSTLISLKNNKNNCAIFTNGDGVTKRDLALQAQVVLNTCSKNGYVSGQMNGPTPNPVCIVAKGMYVIFSFGFNGLAETLVRREGNSAAHCFR